MGDLSGLRGRVEAGAESPLTFGLRIRIKGKCHEAGPDDRLPRLLAR
jgi:hypothetical protein